MKKFILFALTTMVVFISACDDATKERLETEADKRTSSAIESVQNQWDNTRQQVTEMADDKVAELHAAQPLAEAKEKMNQLGEMKLSDFISGDNETKESEETRGSENN